MVPNHSIFWKFSITFFFSWFLVDSTIVKEQTFHYFYSLKFVKVYSRMWSWCMFPVRLRRMHILWGFFFHFVFCEFFCCCCCLFWLCWVLTATCRIFSCGMWDLVPWPGPGSLHWEHSLTAGPSGKSLYILLLLDEVVCRCYYIQLIDGSTMVQLIEVDYVLTAFLPSGSVHSDRGTLKSPIMIMDSSISPCKPLSLCLTCSNAASLFFKQRYPV